MNDFAVVSEGFTDQPVLNRILLTYFKTADAEPSIVFEQPRTDATGGRQWQEYGTWLNVIRYLEDRLYREAFQTSRYLVVQIDADCSELPRYDVPQREGGHPLLVAGLIERIVARLCAIIGTPDLAAYAPGGLSLQFVCGRSNAGCCPSGRWKTRKQKPSAAWTPSTPLWPGRTNRRLAAKTRTTGTTGTRLPVTRGGMCCWRRAPRTKACRSFWSVFRP